MPGSYKCFLFFMFPSQNPVYTPTLPHRCYMPHSSHSSQFEQLNNIWWGTQISWRTKKLLNIKCVLIFSTTFFWNISHSKMDSVSCRSSCKLPVILVRF
jgi:hypothetical protein